MKYSASVIIILMLAVVAQAGTVQYNSNSESGFQWIHAPNSGGAGSEVYVQTGDASVLFSYTGGPTPGTAAGTWNGEGWLLGSFSVSTPSANDAYTVGAVVTINSGTYAGYYHNLGSQLLTWPTGTEALDYLSGGTNPDGSGWVVPEPGTWALFGIGIVTLVGAKLRRRRD